MPPLFLFSWFKHHAAILTPSLPNNSLLYEGALSLRIPYCGETTETQRDVCERRTFPRGCDMHSLTRWCQTGRYNLQSNRLEPANVTASGATVRTSRMPANALVDPDPDPDAVCLFFFPNSPNR